MKRCVKKNMYSYISLINHIILRKNFTCIMKKKKIKKNSTIMLGVLVSNRSLRPNFFRI